MNRISYCEFQPPLALAESVECFWTLTGDGLTEAERRHRVLPDGCMDIIFMTDRARSRASLQAVGTMTRFQVVSLPENSVTVGVRFHPFAVKPWGSLPASELTDRQVPLVDIWRSAAARLEEQLCDATSSPEQVRVLEAALAGRTGCDALPRNVGERQLRRIYGATVGIGPKRLSRIRRFRRLLRLIHTRPRDAWASLALECGYFDQAHMNNEFRKLSGLTPEQYIMSDLSNTGPQQSDTLVE
ncbi:MAG: DUF6597 domain-containing transcriptional factor [Bryobacteraceae bacterium]